MALEESVSLVNLSPEEFQYITEDPVRFDLFFCSTFDYWYQAPMLRDTYENIAGVFGRQCLSEDTEIITSTGKIIKIKNWNGEKLITLDENLKNVISVPTEKIYNGIRDVYCVTTHSGRKIKCTYNHPFRVFDKWKELKDIKLNDFIATPRVINIKGKNTLPRYKLKILAYLISDGSTLPNGLIAFTNGNKKLIKDFINCVYKFNWRKVSIYDHNRRTPIVYINNSVSYLNPIRGWLNKIGYKFKNSTKKEIPSIIFTQNKKNIAIFLNHLFSCDGYIAVSKNHHPTIGYSSSSIKLIYQVQHLLLRFGIISYLRKKRIKCNHKWFDTYELSFGSKKDIITFMFKIGAKEKEEKISIAVKQIKNKCTNNNRDIIPVKIRNVINKKRKENKTRWNKLGFERNIRPNYNPQREKVLKYGEKLNDKQIINYATSDIYWDKIKSIEYIGKKRVYDLKIPLHHNFIAQDIYVHNSGKTDLVSRRENYNGTTNELDDLISILVAPAQRQSENLYGRCTKYLNRSPILLAELKEGRVLQKGIEFINGYKIVNMPIGQSADKVRGYAIDELVFEEAAYIPGAAYEALTDSLLSTAGTEIRIGTPNGKANPLYMAFENAFRIYTIPESRWEAFDITKKDSIVKENKNVDMDDAWSCHHYPSHVGLNTYKDFKVYVAETWEVELKNNRRFAKQHKGWRIIKTENKQYIGQLVTDHWEVIDKLPQEIRLKYSSVKQLLDDPIHVVVGFPQINLKRLKRQLKRPRNVVERENLALFSDDDGVVFPYKFVLRAFRKELSLWTHPRDNLEYYGGLDISKGVGGDYSVITIVAYDKPRIQMVYQWKDNKRRIKRVLKELYNLHYIWKVQKWFLDSNTLGAMPLEDLQDKLGSHYVDGIGFQVKDKMELVANMELILGDNESPCNLFIPAYLEELKHQFKFYTKQLSQDGTKLKYSHPDWEGEHDDELDSLMLACLCAKSLPVVEMEAYFIDPIW